MDLRPPLQAMIARPVPQLPDEQHSGGYCFEPKLDGWRCLAFHRLGGRVELQSRQHKPLTAYFPEIVAAVRAQVPAGTVLDGELVVYRGGRCDFAALQRRVIRPPGSAVAASFVVFDVLALAGRDLRGLPYRKRRKRLRRLLADAAPPLALMPATRELAGAQAWMRDHIDGGRRGRGRQAPRARLSAAAPVVVEGPHPDHRGRGRGRRDRAPERAGGAAAGPARRARPAARGGPHRAVDAARAARARRAAGAAAADASVAGADPVLAVRAAARRSRRLHPDRAAAGRRGRRRRVLRTRPMAAPDGFRRVRGDLQPADLA